VTYLIDTNLISELRRPTRMNAGVASWIAGVAHTEIYVSVVTLMELERGTLMAERNQPDLGKALRWWMANVIIPNYFERSLPVTASIALRAAGFAPPEGRHVADHILAATAAEHDLVLVSRNIKHLQHPGVRLFNPFA
jgi:predicted nucleic acid-binding protein